MHIKKEKSLLLSTLPLINVSFFTLPFHGELILDTVAHLLGGPTVAHFLGAHSSTRKGGGVTLLSGHPPPDFFFYEGGGQPTPIIGRGNQT